LEQTQALEAAIHTGPCRVAWRNANQIVKPVIGKDLAPPGRLGAAMFLSFAPCGDGCLIAEERQRKNLAGLGQALEPFDRDKSINAFKDGP
jgi:hypothetical protein